MGAPYAVSFWAFHRDCGLAQDDTIASSGGEGEEGGKKGGGGGGKEEKNAYVAADLPSFSGKALVSHDLIP